jgi:hypothetical protein
MANIRIKNVSTIKIFVNCFKEFNSVFINIFILGTADKLLRGRSNLKDLIARTFSIFGIICNKAVITTVKSSQFHPSLR